MKKKPVTRLDYCQYLLVTPFNYTLTHFAAHYEAFSHDATPLSALQMGDGAPGVGQCPRPMT